MRVHQSLVDLDDVTDGLARRERAGAPDQRGQVSTLDQLGDQEEHAVLLAVVIDADDARGLQPGQGRGLVAEPEPEALVGGVLRSDQLQRDVTRSEEHTSELQSLMRISYADFGLKKTNIKHNYT